MKEMIERKAIKIKCKNLGIDVPINLAFLKINFLIEVINS